MGALVLTYKDNMYFHGVRGSVDFDVEMRCLHGLAPVVGQHVLSAVRFSSGIGQALAH